MKKYGEDGENCGTAVASYRKSMRIRCITEGEACYMYVAIIMIT